MAETSCIKIQGGNLRGETLELGNHEQHDLIYGGAFLHKCVLDIRGPAFTLDDTNLLNCQIKISQRMSNVLFLETVFENCTFEGEIVGCQFGFRRGQSKSPNAYYRNCDFSRAKLDHCAFFIGDVDSVTWPPWPNVVVLNPKQNEQDWLSIPFPDEMNEIKSAVAVEALSDKTNLAADNAPQAITVDLANFETIDPEIIWPLVKHKTYIVFEGKDQK